MSAIADDIRELIKSLPKLPAYDLVIELDNQLYQVWFTVEQRELYNACCRVRAEEGKDQYPCGSHVYSHARHSHLIAQTEPAPSPTHDITVRAPTVAGVPIYGASDAERRELAMIVNAVVAATSSA